MTIYLKAFAFTLSLFAVCFLLMLVDLRLAAYLGKPDLVPLFIGFEATFGMVFYALVWQLREAEQKRKREEERAQ